MSEELKDKMYQKLSLYSSELEDRIEDLEKLNTTITMENERLNNIKKKAIDELFDLKDMIYKPETREINFDVQNKISSIIKILGREKSDE